MSDDNQKLETVRCSVCNENRTHEEMVPKKKHCKRCRKERQRKNFTTKYRNSPEFRDNHNRKRDEWNKKNPEKLRYNSTKASAKVRELEFTLTFEQWAKIMSLNICECCGESFVDDGKWNDERTVAKTVDRRNNSVGYVEGNCFLLCWNCNIKKRDLSIEEIRMILNYMEKQVEPTN